MLYAGFDCSTQSLSVVVIDATRREVVFRDAITFDLDLAQFGTRHGVAFTEPGGAVHSDPRMWAAALESMLERLAGAVDPQRLRAISGSAQQHGSVYCGATPYTLTRRTSPIWMDSSTARECREIEDALGGAAAVARLTGSRAFPRFTGPQIRKFARDEPEAYGRTQRIHLVSSYLASLLVAEHAPVDHADASGMNLLDINARTWSDRAIEATAPGLGAKLPPLVPSSTAVGRLAATWQTRFGLPPATIVAWSGDNPCSLIGTGLVTEGQLCISLGTSDTIFGPMRQPRLSDDGTGHVFVSPTGDYMGITVFRNGSLARERIRDEYRLDWDGFSAALATTEAANGGALMLPWFEPEITPAVPEARVERRGLEGATPAHHVRALVEAQMMAMASHSAWMGVRPRTVYATGGASVNRAILQIMADVFDADVYRFDSSDSAALGAALRAWQADRGLEWPEVVADLCKPMMTDPVEPIPANVTIYRLLQRRYIELERTALSSGKLRSTP
jgi:xylulokinase